MQNATTPLTLDRLRTLLLQLAPDLEGMALSLPRNYPDYASVIALPIQLIGFLSEGTEENLQRACRGYIQFCQTFKDKQWDFAHNQCYAENDYAQVNEKVYQNLTYMSEVYYPALLFSYLFASNYFAIYRQFSTVFIPLCGDKRGASLEVGVGHGLLSASLLNANTNLVGFGLDVSPVAPEISNRVSAFFHLRNPISTTVGDALAGIPLHNDTPYQVMICAEVLEHLPDPLKLLQNMYAALAEGGILFLTASINMESVDHLYLFRSDDEVLKMIEESGFQVLNRELAFLTTQAYRGDADIIQKLKEWETPATAIVIATKQTATKT
ncbi:MAG TPA: class I SAM-dependent methyltransferase [Bryobacteraceae bacterium]|nr:class I SAM-dependent methyltransferase [Bryobacteraceae bacterium]